MLLPAVATGVKLARKTLCGTRHAGPNGPYDNTCAIRGVPAENTAFREGHIKRGDIFTFTAHHGTKANFCLIEKTGSTEWLNLFDADADAAKWGLYAKALDDMQANKGNVHAVAKRTAPAPSVVFVRNPYTRLLSSYLDKVVGLGGGEGSRISFNGDFAAFVKMVCKEKLDRLQGKSCKHDCVLRDEHISPQSGRCGLNQGFAYDMILRVEEQPMWYETLIKMLGLTKTVRTFDGTLPSGEGGHHAYRLSHNASNCFYKPPGLECADLFTTEEPKMYQGESTSGDSTKSQKHHHGNKQTGHAILATDHIAEYYTPAIAHAVTALYTDDFFLFDYPTWNGEHAESFDALLGQTVGPISRDEQVEQLKLVVSAL